MVKNKVEEYNDFSWTTCFLTLEKYSFGVHTDKSSNMCTHVEQIFLFKAGLLLNIDVVVPFFKSKNIAKNCVSIQCAPHCPGGSVSPANQMPAFIWLTAHIIPLEPLRASGLANECPSYMHPH